VRVFDDDDFPDGDVGTGDDPPAVGHEHSGGLRCRADLPVGLVGAGRCQHNLRSGVRGAQASLALGVVSPDQFVPQPVTVEGKPGIQVRYRKVTASTY